MLKHLRTLGMAATIVLASTAGAAAGTAPAGSSSETVQIAGLGTLLPTGTAASRAAASDAGSAARGPGGQAAAPASGLAMASVWLTGLVIFGLAAGRRMRSPAG